MKIKHLKEKWVVQWEEILELLEFPHLVGSSGKEHRVQCETWLDTEKEAADFVKVLEEEKTPIRSRML